MSLGTGANFRCSVLENSGEVPEGSPQSGTELRVEHSSSPLSGSIRWVEAEGQVSFACQLIVTKVLGMPVVVSRYFLKVPLSGAARAPAQAVDSP